MSPDGSKDGWWSRIRSLRFRSHELRGGCSGYMGHPFAQLLIGTFTPFTLIPEKPCSNRGKISPIHNHEKAPRGRCHLCSAVCSFGRRRPRGNCFKVFQNAENAQDEISKIRETRPEPHPSLSEAIF